MPIDLDETALAKLAREMAINIRPYQAIFADFSITEEDYYELSKLDFFKRAKEQFALEWNSALSAADRVKLTSATAAEEILAMITKRALNPQEPLVNVLGVFKQTCQNAGIGEPNREQKTSERFQITINIGEEVKVFDKTLTPEGNVVDLLPAPAK